MQALGPVALVSLLLNDGLTKAIPGSDINENPNLPVDPELQDKFNRAAVQVISTPAITETQASVMCMIAQEPSFTR